MPDVPSTRERADTGIFLNKDALDQRVVKQFSQMLEEVLKIADAKSILPDITVPNPLPVEMGLRGKFTVWTNLVAIKKPEGASTFEQKPELKEGVNYELEQWEEVVSITDEAKINAGLTAQDLLNAGNAGRGFARAIDGDGLTEMYGAIVGSAGSNWSTASDDDIQEQIGAAQDNVETKGFEPDTVMLTRKQWNRIGRFDWVVNSKATTEEFLQAQFKMDPMLVKKVAYEDDAGATVVLFDPTGEVLIIDKAAYAVFSQRPTTVEFKRSVSRGVDLAYMRKFFKTKAVQLNAADKITGVVL